MYNVHVHVYTCIKLQLGLRHRSNTEHLHFALPFSFGDVLSTEALSHRTTGHPNFIWGNTGIPCTHCLSGVHVHVS